MLDTKKILQLGIGVAVGMIAYHFIQKAMNGGSSNGETAGYIGTTSGSKCRINLGGQYHTFNCGETVNIAAGQGSEWNGYTATCGSQGSFGCTVSNGMQSYSGTIVRPRLQRKVSRM